MKKIVHHHYTDLMARFMESNQRVVLDYGSWGCIIGGSGIRLDLYYPDIKEESCLSILRNDLLDELENHTLEQWR